MVKLIVSVVPTKPGSPSIGQPVALHGTAEYQYIALNPFFHPISAGSGTGASGSQAEFPAVLHASSMPESFLTLTQVFATGSTLS